MRKLVGTIAAACLFLTACGGGTSTAVPAPPPGNESGGLGDVFDEGAPGSVSELFGLPLAAFTARVTELGFGPVRVGWRDGEFLPVTDDLSPGRVTVAISSRTGEEIVVDASIDIDEESDENEAESAGAFDPAAMFSDQMIAEPAVVVPGQTFAVTYPGGRDRGVAYVLEISADGWTPTHLMTATTDGYGDQPTWADLDAEGYGWNDIGISGEGPDTLILPDTAETGSYRLCTANSAENICTPMIVIDDSIEPPTTSAPASDESTSGAMVIDQSDVLLGDVVEVSFPGGLERGLVYLLERSVDDTWVTTHVMTAWNETAGDVAPMWFDIGDEPDVLPSGVVDGVGPDQLRIPDNVEGGLHRICTDGTAEVVCVELTIGPVETGITLAPSDDVASIVSVTDDVAFYPACGNETLELAETSWYVVGHIGYRPFQENLVRLVEQIEATPREPLPAVSPRGIVRVAPPGPGDDIGTLVVWSDGVARWTSESGTIDVWMIDEPIERNWDC